MYIGVTIILYIALDLDIYVHGALNGLNLVEVSQCSLCIWFGFFACFHAISLERSRFSKIGKYFSCPCSTEAVGIAFKPPRTL